MERLKYIALKNKKDMEANKKVRVRFAPSPTGPLHMGGVRTALYNYLFARQNGGTFILRIEDTDSHRFVPGAEDYIIDSLKWCGIEIDEGVSVGGPHAPYRQSERAAIYKKYAEQLVEGGFAYYSFDTSESLNALRAEAESKGETFAYDASVRGSLETSIKLSAEEVASRIARGDVWVIRFKMPENRLVEMDDIIRGHMSVNTNTLDDKVLFKSADNLPTYHLANIVDDHLMEVSHVIRGEEWLPSLPLHYLLYEAFGWERPEFAHLPLLLKPQGKGKLSKRDGDKLGFPVFPTEWVSADGDVSKGYREEGYLPQAFINMLALLGWNPGTEQEIFSMDELINTFSLERVSKSGARFNPEKAKWFNTHYLQNSSDEFLASLLMPMLEKHGVKTIEEKAIAAISLIKNRISFPNDLFTQTSYMFIAPTEFDPKSIRKFWKEENVEHLREMISLFEAMDVVEAEAAEEAIREWVTANEYPMGKVMNTLRLAIIGVSQGPSILEICAFIGKDEMLKRINFALNNIPTK